MDRFSSLLPLVFGHRGASHCAPENTLAAFQLAMELGADGIEFDLHLTRDGQVVVMHDDRVDRTTNGTGRLADMTLEEIQRLDAGSWFGPGFASERVPSLEQVFRGMGSKPLFDLEIKNYSSPNDGLERKVIDLVHRFGLERRVLISSFNPQAIRIFRRELPEAPAMLLLLGGWKGRLELPFFGHWASPDLVGMYYKDLNNGAYPGPDGRRMMVWGPENEQEVSRIVACGIDGVIVDDPGMARRALSTSGVDLSVGKDKNRFVG